MIISHDNLHGKYHNYQYIYFLNYIITFFPYLGSGYRKRGINGVCAGGAVGTVAQLPPWLFFCKLS